MERSIPCCSIDYGSRDTYTVDMIKIVFVKLQNPVRNWQFVFFVNLCMRRQKNRKSFQPALFIGPFNHVERFRNLKFVVKRITNIQSTVLSSSEGIATIHFASK